MMKAGCHVRSATARNAAYLLSETHYTAVVVDHSLTSSECAELASGVRTITPDAKLLLLNALEPRLPSVERLFDATTQCYDGPAALVRAVRDLLFPCG